MAGKKMMEKMCIILLHIGLVVDDFQLLPVRVNYFIDFSSYPLYPEVGRECHYFQKK